MDINYISKEMHDFLKEAIYQTEKDGCLSVCNLEDKLDEMDCPFSGHWDSGSDKVVFIFDDYDVVLKVNVEECGNITECCAYKEAKNLNLEKFFAKSFSPFEISISEKEFLKRAKEEEDEEEFNNRCYEFCSQDIKCYFQEKIEETQRGERYRLGKSAVSVKNLPKSKRGLCKRYEGSTTLKSCIMTFTDELESTKLMKFLKENYINDLHRGNFKMVDNQIKIYDYSGFEGSEDHDYYGY